MPGRTASPSASPTSAPTATRRGARRPVRLQSWPRSSSKIGRAHVWTPVTNAQHVCRLLLEKKKKILNKKTSKQKKIHKHDTRRIIQNGLSQPDTIKHREYK